MTFAQTLDTFAENAQLGDTLARHLGPKLMTQMLDATGKASIRRRNLPAEHIAWLTVAMAMARNVPIRRLVEDLNLSLNGSSVSSSISDARKRLGPDPLAWLFRETALRWTASQAESNFKGLQVFAIDGTVLNVPDEEENRNYFGKHKSREVFVPYPQVRLTMLLDIATRTLRDVNFGPVGVHESVLAEKLMDSIPGNSLTIMDRGFHSYKRFYGLLGRNDNRHFLCRARRPAKLFVKEQLPDGSYLAILRRPNSPSLKKVILPDELVVRVVDFQRKGGTKKIRLISSLLDHKKFPAKDFAALYHQRWDIETAIGEIKTHLLDRKESIRSKHPDGVQQEVWAIMLAYNLIRREMAVAALEFSIPPDRMSFKSCMQMIERFFRIEAHPDSYGRAPEHLRRLRERMARSRNPDRRRRTQPRTIKLRNLGYPQTASTPPRMGLLKPPGP